MQQTKPARTSVTRRAYEVIPGLARRHNRGTPDARPIVHDLHDQSTPSDHDSAHPPRSGGPAVRQLAAGTRRLVHGALRRDPDDRWAAVFGRIAGYSFAVVVVSGVLLLPFFRPSMATVAYHGSYGKLDGAPMSQAYQSVLAISFDVRGGLLIRQVHHWSAEVFVAAVCLRLLRVFFRGRFSGRALPDWLIWVALLPLGMLAAYTGTILPDDGLSGGSLAVITGVLLSVPVIGTHLVFWIFGGAPPGHQIIGRDYWVHILALPALTGALLLLSVRPSPRRARRLRLDPLLVFTCAVLVLLAAVAQINPVWLIGPYQPGSISSGAAPDWYMGFLDGALRLMPAWEVSLAGHPLALSVLIPPIVRKTARLIFYTSDSWNGREAVVSPGCISREEFETDTRRYRGGYPGQHGYPAGVIPVPGARQCAGQAGWLFFATREAAEDHLGRGERGRAGQSAPEARLVKELRRAMADAHPDRGGTAEQFIQARRRYQTALRTAQQ